jgi:hypothetical protein
MPPVALSLVLLGTLTAIPHAGTICGEWLDPPRVAAEAGVAPDLALLERANALRAAHPIRRPIQGYPRAPRTVGASERATYDVHYGVLGRVGELTLSSEAPAVTADGLPVLALRAEGAGSVLGLGHFQRTIDSEFDLRRQASSRWRSTRRSVGLATDETVSDSVVHQAGDSLLIQRRKAPSATPTEQQILAPAGVTSDPLGLIWRLRTQLPRPGQRVQLQMLDGMALWRVEVRAVPGGPVPVPGSGHLADELDAELTPILYNGQRDPGRPERRFRLWLTPDANHVPLRLEMPMGLADAVLILKEEAHLVPRAR